MESLPRLLEHQKTLLRDIEVAARKGDVSGVLASSGKLEMLASFMKRQEEEIARTLVALEGGLSASRGTDGGPAQALTDGHDRKLSKKERGRRRRVDFIRMLAKKGVDLQPVKSVIFKSPHGIRVGIASARENRKRKDNWWLGLPEGEFEHAALLCEERSGNEIRFLLPKEFMREHGESLTRREGQIKFIVFRRDGEFFLRLPGRESVAIEAFRENFSELI